MLVHVCHFKMKSYEWFNAILQYEGGEMRNLSCCRCLEGLRNEEGEKILDVIVLFTRSQPEFMMPSWRQESKKR